MTAGPRSVAVLQVLVLAIIPSIVSWQDSCQTLSTEIEIVKDMLVQDGGQRVPISCVARVTVNKCEGVCESTVSPSVLQYQGLRKNCRCCQEGRLARRRIVLQECYNEDGNLTNFHPTITIRDLRNCSCMQCQN